MTSVGDEAVAGRYAATLAAAKVAIQAARSRAVLAANSELIGLYWDLGRLILDRQAADGWGTKVDRAVLVGSARGVPRDDGAVARRNLLYMRAFAAAWPEPEIVQRLVGRLPWGHNIELLDKLDDPAAARMVRPERDRARLVPGRAGQPDHVPAPPTRRRRTVELRRRPPGRRLRADAAADQGPVQPRVPHPRRPVAERDLERALVAQVERFLLELGAGFAFVGRQWRLDLDGDEFFIDLLMFHIPTNRYVVLELKTTKLTPADVGQLNFYVAAVDGEVRLEHHAPTVGLLLCATRNERTVRYALSRSTSPMAVAGYRYSELPARRASSVARRSRDRRRRQRRPRPSRPRTGRSVTERPKTGRQDRLRATKRTHG